MSADWKEGDKAIDSTKKRLEELTKATAPAMAAIGAVVYGIVSFVNGLADTAAELTTAAAHINITTDALQSLRHGFAQAGVSSGEADAAMAGLVPRMQALRQGGGNVAASFNRLGVHVYDAHRRLRPVSDLMPEIAQRMDRITNPAERVRVAIALFGDAGRRLEPILRSGTGGLAELQAQFTALGGGMSGEAIASAQAYTASLEMMRTAALSLRSMIGLWLLPTFKQLTDGAAKGVVEFIKLTRGTHVVQIAIGLLGAAMVAAALPVIVAWAPVWAPFAAGAALLSAIVLIVDDVWTAFQGGDSVTGRLININFGLFGMRDALAGVKVLWLDIQDAASEALDTVVHFAARAQSLMPHLTEESRRIARDSEAEDVARQAGAPGRRRRYEAERARLGAPVAQSATSLDAQVAAAAENQRRQREIRLAGGNPYANYPGTPAPAGGARAPAVAVTHQHGPISIAIHNPTGDGRAIAQQVRAELERAQREQAEAAHPQEPNHS